MFSNFFNMLDDPHNEGMQFGMLDTTQKPPPQDDYNFGKKGKSQEEGRTRNPLGVSDQTMDNLREYMTKKIEELTKELTGSENKSIDEQKAERERVNKIFEEYQKEINQLKVSSRDGQGDPNSNTLIEFLKKRDDKIKLDKEVKQLDTNEHFKNARTERIMRQEILVAKLQQGAMNNNARLANDNRRTAGKVMQNRRLDHVPARGKPIVLPMNSISFNMGVGTS